MLRNTLARLTQQPNAQYLCPSLKAGYPLHSFLLSHDSSIILSIKYKPQFLLGFCFYNRMRKG